MKPKAMSREQQPDLDDPLLRRFFGDQFGHQQGRSFRAPKQNGLGSGVIVSEDGYILTNNHVVDNADEIKVALNPDGKEYTAKVVGTDPKSDVAVLKIDAKNLPYLSMADSDQIEVGDVVLAIGNPFGIGQTVTMGIVSATGRANMGMEYEDFIQTDAAINPGNSGGALVDANGRLLGINTAILSRSGGNQGIGFAIPVNLARFAMESLIKDGRVIRGFVGVRLQDVDPSLAEQFGLKGDNLGAVITDVTPKSPAEKAGLQDGDVIVGFNGKTIHDSRHLKLEVGKTAPGTKVPVKIVRDGKTKTMEVTLKEVPQAEKLAKDHSPSNDSDEALAGVGVSDLDSSTRSQLKIPHNVKGALVTSVDEDSAAYDAGLRQGDVVLEINRKPIASAQDAVEMTENLKKGKTLLRVWSNGGSRYIVVDEEKMG
jgi:serine protease Do